MWEWEENLTIPYLSLTEEITHSDTVELLD